MSATGLQPMTSLVSALPLQKLKKEEINQQVLFNE